LSYTPFLLNKPHILLHPAYFNNLRNPIQLIF
jgi:hypothetical protein